ncbi:MAG TPA: ATP-binding protein [Kofleriaceae bacterium]|nr:ATP-binding protein [Kofleriaceae bacterium]
MRALRPYALALLAIAVALGLALTAERFGLEDVYRPLFIIAIVAAVWYGGAGPGVGAVVAASLCIDYFFTPPRYELGFEAQDVVNTGVFVVFALVAGWFAARRRQIERDLHRALDQLQREVAIRTRQASLLDLTHDSILVRDMNDVITYWNRGAQELLGWTSAQAVGKRAHELLRTVFPCPIERIRSELLATGRWEGELTKTTADGKQVVVASRWSLQRDADERPIAVLDINNDITERKRGEDEIRKLNAQLGRRTLDLEASNKELEAFAYSASHDLRAPLRHVAAYAELLQKTASSDLDERSRRYVTNLLESAKKMGALIDDLLAFSRIGRAETRITLVSLDELLHEVLRDLEREADGRDIEWKIGATLPSVHGDRSMLKLALFNLVSNAVKFTRTRQRAEIEIGCTVDASQEVVAFVRDNGVGFDMKYANKLFGVFQRLHLPEEFEGTGIGLATVQRIVARHGGRVWAEGVLDGGATFYLTLPKP